MPDGLGTNVEVLVRVRQTELRKEDMREPRIVVLTRVHENVVEPELDEPLEHQAQADELRAGAGYDHHLHLAHYACGVDPTIAGSLKSAVASSAASASLSIIASEEE